MRLLVTGGSGFIGTNLIELALTRGIELCNIDIAPPRHAAHARLWRKLDILAKETLTTELRAFAPSHVIHLAARTDTAAGLRLHDYPANTRGTGNVIAAVAATPSVDRLVVASSQFVCRPGVLPSDDELYEPHTIYGWSKVVTEQLTRHGRLDSAWTIVRPTTIWGPHSPTHPARMVRTMRRGLYLHPTGSCVRGYGYVENLAWQLLALLETPRQQSHGRVFYLGDRLIELRSWVDAFARRLNARRARAVPRPLLGLAARGGDLISRVQGEPFLLQSGRFRSMTESYPVPMEPIFELCGEPPFSLAEGVDRTVRWLESKGG